MYSIIEKVIQNWGLGLVDIAHFEKLLKENFLVQGMKKIPSYQQLISYNFCNIVSQVYTIL
jgi:hypothetical protein